MPLTHERAAAEDPPFTLLFMQPRDSNISTLGAWGTATVRARPDVADVRLGVITRSENAKLAGSNNTKRVTKVRAAIKALGVPESAVRTSGLQIEPEHEWDEEAKKHVMVGYRAVTGIWVETALDLAGVVYEACVKAGASADGEVSFRLKDHEKHRREAVALATQSAVDELRAMAKALDVTLSGPPSTQMRDPNEFLAGSLDYDLSDGLLDESFRQERWVAISRAVYVSYALEQT